MTNFDLEIEEGEFIGLIGQNGAGKTTLIKMLTGIIQPSQGEISVFGYKPYELKDEFKKNYSVVMGQKSQLWWDLPAIDSFLLNKELYEINDEDYKKNLSFLVELLGVEKLLKIQVRNLSLGERMKMELILALLHNPSILFLDEPTIGLDVIAQKQIRQFLKEINKEKGITIILTNHYMEDIKYLCDRAVVVRNGTNFWFTKVDNIYKLENELVNFSFKVPGIMYKGIGKIIFYFILPYGLIATMPTEFLAGTMTISGWIISMGVCSIFTLLTRFLWKKGLARYSSASS